MSKITKIQANVDSETVSHVNDILTMLGLTPTAVVNMLYHAIEIQGGIPFDVKLGNQQLCDLGLIGPDVVQVRSYVDSTIHYMQLRASFGQPEWLEIVRALYMGHCYLYSYRHQDESWNQIVAGLVMEACQSEKMFTRFFVDDLKSKLLNNDIQSESSGLLLKESRLWFSVYFDKFYNSRYYSSSSNWASLSDLIQNGDLDNSSLSDVVNFKLVHKLYQLVSVSLYSGIEKDDDDNV